MKIDPLVLFVVGAPILFIGIVAAVTTYILIKRRATKKPSMIDAIEDSPPSPKPSSRSNDKIIETYTGIPTKAFNFGRSWIALGIVLIVFWLYILSTMEPDWGIAISLPPGLLFIAAGALALWIREPASLGVVYLVFVADTIRQIFTRGFSGWLLVEIFIGFGIFITFFSEAAAIRAYHKLPEELKTGPEYHRAGQVFPTMSILLSGVGLFVALVSFALTMLFFDLNLISYAWFSMFVSLKSLLGIMGAAIGLSGLIHGIKNQRWMMVLGLIIGLAAIVL